MLTVNAGKHPGTQRFHKLGDEKRTVVVLDDVGLDDWLTAPDDDAMREMLALCGAEMLTAAPARLNWRGRRQADRPLLFSEANDYRE